MASVLKQNPHTILSTPGTSGYYNLIQPGTQSSTPQTSPDRVSSNRGHEVELLAQVAWGIDDQFMFGSKYMARLVATKDSESLRHPLCYYNSTDMF